MDWINLGLLAATCAAAGVAVWQAIIAKGARDDANTASATATDQADAAKRAAAAAEASAAAQERASSALERQADLAERLAAPVRPFELSSASGGPYDQRWQATNVLDVTIYDVWVNTADGADEQWIQPDRYGVAIDLEPGESIGFTFLRRQSSPPQRTVWLEWSPDRETHRRQIVVVGDA